MAEEQATAEKAALEAAEKTSAGKGGKKGGKSDARSKSAKAKSPEKSQSPKGSKKSSSPKSGKDKKGGKGSKPATPVLIEQVVEPPKEMEPQPGDENYIYVNEKVEEKMSKIICDYWDAIEVSYIDGSKYVFRKIRIEREQIIRYFFTIKTNFLEYLRRPDTKQIELESFIKVRKRDGLIYI